MGPTEHSSAQMHGCGLQPVRWWQHVTQGATLQCRQPIVSEPCLMTTFACHLFDQIVECGPTCSTALTVHWG
jgi:hypothetical protein